MAIQSPDELMFSKKFEKPYKKHIKSFFCTKKYYSRAKEEDCLLEELMLPTVNYIVKNNLKILRF